LDEITVADRGDDFAGAEMLMFSAIQDQEHSNDRVCCGLLAQSLVPLFFCGSTHQVLSLSPSQAPATAMFVTDLRPKLRISERLGAPSKLLGDILDPSNRKPCFGLICYPISRGRVISKCTNPLKSAIRPLGLDHPFVAITEYDVKERFFRLCHGG
jgi:hypothetical protein